MFGARKRGLIRQKLEIIRFFSLFYFYLDPNVSLKQQQKIYFSVHSRKFKTRKILFWPIRESSCSRNAKISRIFPLAKVSAPKVDKTLSYHTAESNKQKVLLLAPTGVAAHYYTGWIPCLHFNSLPLLTDQSVVWQARK